MQKNGKAPLVSKRDTNFHIQYHTKVHDTLRQRNVEIRASSPCLKFKTNENAVFQLSHKNCTLDTIDTVTLVVFNENLNSEMSLLFTKKVF